MDQIETLVDARGLLCPLPVLKARKALSRLSAGAFLRVLTDDPAALIDMPHFCAEAGHALLTQQDTGTGMSFVIRKGG
ncbi:sulfurtransferase TusA family protein [Tropicimonas sp. IMCC34043]|uniref:sulfurtransferase TusA family protein n=1 Tax=Tropicimonas sp. IMCC34043 TaxID=2248760 RepID=UPI000E27A2CF|nr:sulfurtransferase TusA family protein [Tropicimonas sp. IMCC34043]